MIPRQKISNSKDKPLLLYSPLDWGLGHTMRSVPLLKRLLADGWNIIVACNSTQNKILAHEVPGLKFETLEGYEISYGRSGWATRLKLMLQVPKILIKINREKAWVKRFLAKNEVAAIVSDNRYGFRDASVPSYFITHQLRVLTGFGNIIDRILQYFLYHFINKFTECWVPDNEINSLAGKLSHPSYKPSVPVKYIGHLSRLPFPSFNHRSFSEGDLRGAKRGGFRIATPPTINYNYCIILSGPEPQRTILEKIIISKFINSEKKSILIRGLINTNNNFPSSPSLSIINFANTEKLTELILSSETIICRPGYTSLMDLVPFNKKLILIPTPGQTEQEYLAKHLSKNYSFVSISQKEFPESFFP